MHDEYSSHKGLSNLKEEEEGLIGRDEKIKGYHRMVEMSRPTMSRPLSTASDSTPAPGGYSSLTENTILGMFMAT